MTISVCRYWTSWAWSMGSRLTCPTLPSPRSWRSYGITFGGRSRRSSKSRRAQRTSGKLPKIRRVSPTSTASWENPTRNWLNCNRSSRSSNHKYSSRKSSHPTLVCQVRGKTSEKLATKKVFLNRKSARRTKPVVLIQAKRKLGTDLSIFLVGLLQIAAFKYFFIFENHYFALKSAIQRST